jgi:acyl-CoA synthetase (AMP-forming)/AMP-acid ligase II
MTDHEFPSLVSLLRRRAEEQGGAYGYTFLVNGEAAGEPLTYAALDRRSREVAAALQQSLAPGDRALLLYPPGLEFLAGFFGCLYAGVVAVPTYPPHPVRPSQSLPRLRAIAAEAGVGTVLCTGTVAAQLPALFGEVPALAGLPVLATDGDGLADAGSWREPVLGPGTLAFLQYTSGSTAAPKGVMVSHGNLLHNLASIRGRTGRDPDRRGVSWLPVHHDMGLIGGVLQPLFEGFPSYLMAPVSFVQKPVRWLQAVSSFRATTSGGPNFAYDLCVRQTTAEQRRGLDLSSWRIAFNGAEPIRQDTLDRFRRAFAPHGFRSDAFHPVYGLAEATLLVSGKQLNAAPSDGAVTLVGCGRPSCGTRVVIADPAHQTPLPPGEVGEVWVNGPSVAQGYWGRPEETDHTFRARLAGTGEGPFLRTGDLGFLRDGELFITGRIKDVIIIRGRKHYPQDLEHTVEASHPAVRPSGSAALALATANGERLLIVAEIDHRPRPRPPLGAGRPAFEDLIGAIRQAVAEQHELQTHAVLLVPPGALPKTTSGKQQRHACRQRFLDGTFEALAHWSQRPEPADADLPRKQTVG